MTQTKWPPRFPGRFIEQERNFEQVGEHEPDRDGGQPGGGQKGKSPTAIIAVQDGPQTGGNERGNPGV